jgi:hypothetical protein
MPMIILNVGDMLKKSENRINNAIPRYIKTIMMPNIRRILNCFICFVLDKKR